MLHSYRFVGNSKRNLKTTWGFTFSTSSRPTKWKGYINLIIDYVESLFTSPFNFQSAFLTSNSGSQHLFYSILSHLRILKNLGTENKHYYVVLLQEYLYCTTFLDMTHFHKRNQELFSLMQIFHIITTTIKISIHILYWVVRHI